MLISQSKRKETTLPKSLHSAKAIVLLKYLLPHWHWDEHDYMKLGLKELDPFPPQPYSLSTMKHYNFLRGPLFVFFFDWQVAITKFY